MSLLYYENLFDPYSTNNENNTGLDDSHFYRFTLASTIEDNYLVGQRVVQSSLNAF